MWSSSWVIVKVRATKALERRRILSRSLGSSSKTKNKLTLPSRDLSTPWCLCLTWLARTRGDLSTQPTQLASNLGKRLRISEPATLLSYEMNVLRTELIQWWAWTNRTKLFHLWCSRWHKKSKGTTYSLLCHTIIKQGGCRSLQTLTLNS